MMRRLQPLGPALGLLCITAPLAAQHGTWEELVAGADSFAVMPSMPTGPSVACGPGVEVRDSVEVSGPGEEFLFKARSARTRGYFTSVEVPVRGSGRFALLRVSCDSTGRPLELVVERSHRYFYLRFSLRPRPTYSALRFRSGGGTWEAFAWDPARRAFAPRQARPAGEREWSGSGRSQAPDTKVIRVTEGETFTLTLASNPSTAHRWMLAESTPEGILQLLRQEYASSGLRPVPGGGGSDRWTFRALRPGRADLKLDYRRGRMGPIAERRRYVVHVGSGSRARDADPAAVRGSPPAGTGRHQP